MLSQLTIQNFGLIDKIAIEFDEKLNILTGETGAGKSILIDALRSVLGERIDASSIRDPKNPCVIEAVLDLNQNLLSNEVFQDFLTDTDTQLIIQRSLAADGKNKIKINGLNVTVGQLKSIGNHLIDFHGAHDHQMLLSENEHLKMLDKLVEFKNLKTDYTDLYREYTDLQKKLASLTELSQTRQRDVDLLAHQVKELEAVPLSEDKYEEISQEIVKINNAQKLYEHIQNLLGILEDEDVGVHQQLRKAFTPLKNLNQIDEKTTPLLDELTLIQEQTTDLISQLTHYAESLSFDPSQAEEINRIYDTYQDIRRKYGPSLTEAAHFYQETKAKLDLIKDFENNDSQLRQNISDKEKELTKIANKISKARQAAAEDLNTTIEKELKELGINHVQFEVRFEKTSFGPEGSDHIVFYISPNAGEELKPLAQIVSSGEAARVMLALKKALIKVDPIPVLIFDEIDAQIGGRLGTITGKKLTDLAKHRQVILITHLPQIASFANRHFKVVKSVKASRATTEVKLLDNKARVEEIAQMMSGQNATKISLQHAEDMLTTAQKP
ncbi:MAG: DNA repair protein RecN [Candidatus Omnitrophica bacterium]|nr:DNA repair protein RecN [Candidatus Omnitrophota bacterium]